MSAILSSPLTADLELPPHVWRGGEQSAHEELTLSTGLPALDAVLPGGGWPVGQLVEVLQSRPQQHVWRLLVPALARAVQAQRGPVVLVGPPHPVFAPSLAAQGLAPERLLWVKAVKPAARLWAAEQALRCAEAVAVLAWLPQGQAADLRRLHLAAQQHRRLLFVFRPENARQQSSPARLRLLLESGEALKVHVLKRRGPPLMSPVPLPPWQALLSEWLRARSSVPLPPPLGEGGEGAPRASPAGSAPKSDRLSRRRTPTHAPLDRTPTSAG